mmetsp:Transcript_134260/g.388666  ORF Transcript_134260/g.388666 Transcript_134260/m.388666 type:complete len:88 (+) Transcript_134260:292-555(+)
MVFFNWRMEHRNSAEDTSPKVAARGIIPSIGGCHFSDRSPLVPIRYNQSRSIIEKKSFAETETADKLKKEHVGSFASPGGSRATSLA